MDKQLGKAEVQNLVIVLLQGLHFNARDGVVDPERRTWVAGHVPGHAVVAVEELLPQELVAGHGAPLPAHEAHREHVGVVQVQEDLKEHAVREQGAARGHRVILPPHRERAALCSGLARRRRSPCAGLPAPHFRLLRPALPLRLRGAALGRPLGGSALPPAAPLAAPSTAR
uniref:Uncharacterized protein n=1 Tax=Phasianus colchicus TaxID=9054 RepID=A0A669QN91_PHACC